MSEQRTRCQECDGRGMKWGDPIGIYGEKVAVQCEACRGTGWVPVVSETMEEQEEKE